MTPKTHVHSIILECDPGAELFSSLCEAIEKCAREQVTVILVHNEREYAVDIDDLITAIKSDNIVEDNNDTHT